VRKLRRKDTQADVERALTLLWRLCQLQGPPRHVIPEAEALLREFHLTATGLEELRNVINIVAAHGVDTERLVVDFGLGRGLHYYTGAIFEIYANDGLQLCGGGRYDDLVTALGGRQPVPAVGFAYGLERVVASVDHPNIGPPQPEVIVVAEEDAYAYALEVAQTLRERGFIVTTDLRGRSVANNTRDAVRRGVTFLALVGAEQRLQGEILWRDLRTHEERRIGLRDLPAAQSQRA
jgi:histidyl-tRNA synthetase